MPYESNQFQKGWDTTVIKSGGLASRLAAFEKLSKPKDDAPTRKIGITNPDILARIAAAKKKAAANNVQPPPKKQFKTWTTPGFALKATPGSRNAGGEEKENQPKEEKPEGTEEENKIREEREVKEKEEAKKKAEEAAKIKAEADAKAEVEAESKAKDAEEVKAKVEVETKAEVEKDAKDVKAATKIQAIVRSMLCRAAVMKLVEGMIADLTDQKNQNENKYEEDKKTWEENQARRKKKLEEERKLSQQSLVEAKSEINAEGWGWGFIGPLQLPVARIPHWWMDVAPHKTLFSEDLEGLEEAHWEHRHAHLEQAGRKERQATGSTTTAAPHDDDDDDNDESKVLAEGSSPQAEQVKEEKEVYISEESEVVSISKDSFSTGKDE